MSMFFEQQMNQMMQSMRDELTQHGFKELRTPEEVDQEFENSQGTILCVINSVCGCAAGLARPAAIASLKHDKKPDRLVTVFAGQDREATARAREYFTGYPPSSPSYALLKDGKIVGMIERQQIEYHSQEEIEASLQALYDQFC